jgi:hypothetical protein
MKLQLLTRLLVSSFILLVSGFCTPASAVISEDSTTICVPSAGGGTGYAYLSTYTYNTSASDYTIYATMGVQAEADGGDSEGSGPWVDVRVVPGANHHEGYAFTFYQAIPAAYTVYGQHRFTVYAMSGVQIPLENSVAACVVD